MSREEGFDPGFSGLALGERDHPLASALREATRQKGTFHAVTHHPQFRILWSAGVITQLGQWFQTVPLGWLALTLTNDPAFVGQVGFASGLPMLLLSLPAGALLDRIDRRRALLACQLIGAVIAFTLAVINWQGLIAPWHLIVASILNGCLMAVVQPATQTLVPALVPRDDLPNALGLSAAGNSSTRIIGPSLAGGTIYLVGIGTCFFLQSAALLLAAALTLRLRLSPDAKPATPGGSGLLEGLRIIWRNPTLTGLLLFGCGPALFSYPYIQMLPVFARDVYHLGPQGLGFLLAMGGIGSFTGALTIARLGNIRHKGLISSTLGLAYGLLLAGFALSPWLALAAPLLILLAGIGSIFHSTNLILLQFATSEEMRGRVMGAQGMSFSLMPLGALLIGALAQRFGAPAAVAFGGLTATLCIALVLLRYRTIIKL